MDDDRPRFQTADGRLVEIREPTSDQWEYILAGETDDDQLRRMHELGLAEVRCIVCDGSGCVICGRTGRLWAFLGPVPAGEE
jgi:hypothetical protein